MLFADASRIDLRALRREYALPLRLLGIGLPLTIVLGALLASMLSGQLTLAEACVLAILLAPTDAALGQTVIADTRLPMRIGLYALLSLTLVRMLPVALAMWGTHARPRTVAFVGWFGPRGLASIVFALIVVQEANLPHGSTIVLTAYVTVGISTFAHGISASPLTARYARWLAAHPRERLSDAELAPAVPIRARHGS